MMMLSNCRAVEVQRITSSEWHWNQIDFTSWPVMWDDVGRCWPKSLNSFDWGRRSVSDRWSCCSWNLLNKWKKQQSGQNWTENQLDLNALRFFGGHVQEKHVVEGFALTSPFTSKFTCRSSLSWFAVKLP